MAKKDDGGSAFPGEGARLWQDGTWNKTHCPGMSLRDWFAGLAMQGYLASTPVDDDIADLIKGSLAQDTYRLADAMLAERSKTNE